MSKPAGCSGRWRMMRERWCWKDKYVLSLKDLNLSAHLSELVEVGIDSFKIEGRLKEADYVANVTSYYSGRLDEIVARNEELAQLGAGYVKAAFEADPDDVNRGCTDYFFVQEENGYGEHGFPEMDGEEGGHGEAGEGKSDVGGVVGTRA
ncbi:MAG: U32 family peptidase [Butyricimonas faecihominis]